MVIPAVILFLLVRNVAPGIVTERLVELQLDIIKLVAPLGPR
jgi:hypothetical protein